jgi:hypothetical protein
MNLYDQLQYNWERGFYSVVFGDGLYRIFSTKDYTGDLRMTDGYKSIEEAKKYIGERHGYNKSELDEEFSHWQIKNTIHPSELMGREGFQVGDRVIFKDGEEERIATITGHWNDYGLIDIEWYTDNDIVSLNVSLKDLKPVLPVEEKRDIKRENCETVRCTACNRYIALDGYCLCDVGQAMKILHEKGFLKDGHPVLPVEEKNVCMKCGVGVNANDIGVLRTDTDYFCCYSCDKEVNKVIELLKKTRVIKDGHIVNL